MRITLLFVSALFCGFGMASLYYRDHLMSAAMLVTSGVLAGLSTP